MTTAELATLLAEARVRHGLTQAEVAAKCGRSRVTVMNWEGGRHLPNTFEALRAWASAVGYELTLQPTRWQGPPR